MNISVLAQSRDNKIESKYGMMREAVKNRGSREHWCQIVSKLNREEEPCTALLCALCGDDCLIVITGPWYSSELWPGFDQTALSHPDIQ